MWKIITPEVEVVVLVSNKTYFRKIIKENNDGVIYSGTQKNVHMYLTRQYQNSWSKYL
jgi:hypothetical protein